MTGRRDFRPQDLPIFRPYPDEIPWELLALADPDQERVFGYADVDFMRVAKRDDEVVGVYVLQRLEPTVYRLCNLAVSPECRGRGLGGWLLGHAIGIAESKGGREIRVNGAPLKGLFRRFGFVVRDGDLCLTLIPE